LGGYGYPGALAGGAEADEGVGVGGGVNFFSLVRDAMASVPQALAPAEYIRKQVAIQAQAAGLMARLPKGTMLAAYIRSVLIFMTTPAHCHAARTVKSSGAAAGAPPSAARPRRRPRHPRPRPSSFSTIRRRATGGSGRPRRRRTRRCAASRRSTMKTSSRSMGALPVPRAVSGSRRSRRPRRRSHCRRARLSNWRGCMRRKRAVTRSPTSPSSTLYETARLPLSRPSAGRRAARRGSTSCCSLNDRPLLPS